MEWNEWFIYEEGILYWKKSPGSNVKKGDQAGRVETDGYNRIKLKNKNYSTHRIIWEMFNEKINDKLKIDHIDGNRNNNFIENLRLATFSQNSNNYKKPKNNTSGYKGVSWKKQNNKWLVQITVNNKRVYIGYFIDLLTAAKAYNEAALKYHGEFAKLNKVD